MTAAPMMDPAKKKRISRKDIAPDLLEAAATRWLNVTEIMFLLGEEQTIIPLRGSPPEQPPASGALLLYDRNVTRNYKADKHDWLRKRNSSKVREDHVKLRVKGTNRVSGCYVHGSAISTLHRRAYHLLTPTDPSSGKLVKDLILVHYLDTECAAAISAQLSAHMTSPVAQEESHTGYQEYHEYLECQDYSAYQDHKEYQEYLQFQQNDKSHEPQDQERTELKDYHEHKDCEERPSTAHHATPTHRSFSRQTPPPAPLSPPLLLTSDDYTLSPTPRQLCSSLPAQNLSPMHQPSLSMLDVETLDELWSQIMDDEANNLESEVMQADSNPINDPVAQKLQHELVNTMEHTILHADNHLPCALERRSEVSKENQTRGKRVSMYGKHCKQLSSSNLVSKTCTDNSDDQTVQTIMEVTVGSINGMDDVSECSSGTSIGVSSQLELQDPQTLDHQVFIDQVKPIHTPLPDIVDFTPDRISIGKTRAAKLVISLSAPLCELPPLSNGYTWNTFAAFFTFTPPHTEQSYHDTARDAFVGRPQLTPVKMLSPFAYKCHLPTTAQYANTSYMAIVSVKTDQIDSDASRLADAVQISLQTAWNAKLGSIANGTLKANNLPRPSLFSHELEAVVLRSQISQDTITFVRRKSISVIESNSSVDSGTEASRPALAAVPGTIIQAAVPGTIIQASVAHQSDDDSVSSLPLKSRIKNKFIPVDQETVEPHCKIRLVERVYELNRCENFNQLVYVSKAHTSVCPIVVDYDLNPIKFLGDAELCSIENDVLDSILDELLVRFVELLMDSDVEDNSALLSKLNKCGFSGFTLLHYASLYNLETLFHLLLAHGANPNTTTDGGGLTPLHLACGAGNMAIVDILVRNGSKINALDSLGRTPLRHALRNGHAHIAQFLVEKAKSIQAHEVEEMETSFPNSVDDDEVLHEDNEKILRSAFSTLSLKDKVGMVYFMTRQARIGSDCSPFKANDYEHNMSTKNTETTSMGSKENSNRFNRLYAIGAIVTESERQNLDIAMKLMSESEMMGIVDHNRDARSWILRRNYIAMREALKAHQKHIFLQSECWGRQHASTKLSQALAMLVLRKNMIDLTPAVPNKAKA